MALLGDLSVRIGANTAELRKGLDSAKQSVNKFGKNTQKGGKSVQNSFKGIGDSVKGMAGEISSQLGIAGGALSGLAGSFGSAITAVKGLTAGMNLFKVALIGTGVGALVVALGALIAYFTKTQEGADFVSKAMAGIGAVVDVVIDTVSALGGVIFEAVTNPQKALEDFGNAIKNFVLDKFKLLMSGIDGIGSAISLLFEGEFKAAANTAGKALLDITRATNPVAWGMEAVGNAVGFVTEKYGEASEEAAKAYKLQDDAIKLEEAKIALKLKNSEREIKLSELKRNIEDRENFTVQQRAKMVEEALALQKVLADSKIGLAEEELRIKRETDALANNMRSDDEATIDLQIAVNALKREENERAKELVTKQAELNTNVRSQAEAQAKILALRKEEEEIVARQANLKLSKQSSIGINVDDSNAVEQLNSSIANLSGMVQPVKLPVIPDLDLTTSLEDMQMQAQAAAQIMQQTLNNAFTGIGEGLASALTGEGGIRGILNGLLGLVIDFGAQFGKLLISIGVAKVSLESLGISGVGAIIAGTALVALTGVAKSMLSKGIGGGSPKGDGFAVGGMVGGTSYTGDNVAIRVNSGERVLTGEQNGIFENMAKQLSGGSVGNQKIHITGRLVGSGNDLIAVIDETSRRNKNNF